MNELLTLPALELARRIRTRAVSVSEVLETHIARIEAVNPHLNALVAHDFAAARSEARQKEAELSRGGELPPFFGVPATVKELISVRGFPFTAGVVKRKGKVGLQDAPLVTRMREAGLIILGVTNVAEAGLWVETNNAVYGRTNNAYDLSRIAGGSTGGEGALIGAAASPIGLGADVGGSIRNPCFFNGIVGHKATGALLPAVGHWPSAEGERGRFCVSGPMGRTVADVTELLRAFSPAQDPYRDPAYGAFVPRGSIEPGAVTVYHFASNGLAPLSSEMAARLEETVSRLSQLGFRTQAWKPTRLRRTIEMWSAMIAETEDMTPRALLGDGEPIDLLGQWARLLLGRASHPASSLLVATMAPLSSLSHARNRGLMAMARDLALEVEAKLGSQGVLLCPVFPWAAPKHGRPLLSPLAFSYCGLFNVLELPATAVPTGFDSEGLPLGVQLAGARAQDALTLAVAGYVERAFGGWRPVEMPRGA